MYRKQRRRFAPLLSHMQKAGFLMTRLNYIFDESLDSILILGSCVFVNTTLISHCFVLILTFTSHKLHIKFKLLKVPLM